jgi:aminotransferase
MHPSLVVSNTQQATSIKYNNIVYEMKQRGEKVTVLSLGEAFFDIPLYPIDDLPFPDVYHYSHSRGLPQLREKLARYYCEHYGVEANPGSEILITAGSKAAIYFSMLALLDPGDEVIMQEPTWVSYPEQVKMCHGVPVMIPYDAPTSDYEKYITPRTKLIIVNNPHNPRGEVFSKRDTHYLVDLARQNNLSILSDEAYSDFVPDQNFVSLSALDPHKEHVIVVNSLSKNLGMSGWRIGYIIAQAPFVDEVLKINQHIVTCAPTILQLYVDRHLDDILEVTLPQVQEVVCKRREVERFLDELGLSYLPGSATFYFFVSIAPSRLTSDEFATRLLCEDHVCVVPGIGYGESCDSFVRVSVGSESIEDVKTGLLKVRELIRKTS